MRETLSVGKAADEENSTAGVTSGYNRGHEIQHRRCAEFIVHLIILSILAGLLIYYYARFGGGQAGKPENTTIVIINVKIVTPITQATPPATGTHHYDWQQKLVTTPVPQKLYEGSAVFKLNKIYTSTKNYCSGKIVILLQNVEEWFTSQETRQSISLTRIVQTMARTSAAFG